MLGNKISISNSEQLQIFIDNLKAEFESRKHLDITIELDTRTKLQNNAMHRYFREVSKALTDAGFDANNFFKEGYSLPFTEHIVKDELWFPLMKAIANVESTTKLNTKQVSEIFEHLNNKLAERGVHVPFPSVNEVLHKGR